MIRCGFSTLPSFLTSWRFREVYLPRTKFRRDALHYSWWRFYLIVGGGTHSNENA